MSFKTAKQVMEQQKNNCQTCKDLGMIKNMITGIFIMIMDVHKEQIEHVDQLIKQMKGQITDHHASLDWVIKVLVDLTKKPEGENQENEPEEIQETQEISDSE